MAIYFQASNAFSVTTLLKNKLSSSPYLIFFWFAELYSIWYTEYLLWIFWVIDSAYRCIMFLLFKYSLGINFCFWIRILKFWEAVAFYQILEGRNILVMWRSKMLRYPPYVRIIFKIYSICFKKWKFNHLHIMFPDFWC